MSSTIDPASIAAAQVNWSPKASRIAENPHAMLPVVNMLGAVTRSRSRVLSWRSETTAAPDGDFSRHRSSSRRPDFSVAGLSGAPGRATARSRSRRRRCGHPTAATSSTCGGHEDVHPRAELHQADALAGAQHVARRRPGSPPGGPPGRRSGGTRRAAPRRRRSSTQGDLAALVLGGALEAVGGVPRPGR